ARPPRPRSWRSDSADVGTHLRGRYGDGPHDVPYVPPLLLPAAAAAAAVAPDLGGVRVRAPVQVAGAPRRGKAPQWTPESVITEIQHFVEAHGEVPRLADLNPGHAKITGQVWR